MKSRTATVKGFILIVALQLLGFVIAAGLSFPWAVEKSIGLRERILVQWMIPGRGFSLAARTAGEGRR